MATAANDNVPRLRYETGAGNAPWVVPEFEALTKPEMMTLAKPLLEFYEMVVEATSVITACRVPGTEHAVYIISDIYGREVKIGKAANPPFRLAQLQTGNPRKLFLHRVFWMGQEDADAVERAAHASAARKHVRLEGEWFSCSPSDAHSIVASVLDFSKVRHCAMTPLSELWRAA